MTPWSADLTPAMAAQASALAAVVPTLRTERLILRAPPLTDFAAYGATVQSERAVHIGGPFSIEDIWVHRAPAAPLRPATGAAGARVMPTVSERGA